MKPQRCSFHLLYFLYILCSSYLFWSLHKIMYLDCLFLVSVCFVCFLVCLDGWLFLVSSYNFIVLANKSG